MTKSGCDISCLSLLWDLVDGESWWQALLELIGLLLVVQHEGVQVSATPDLEFDAGGVGSLVVVLLDAGRFSTLPAVLNELLDIVNLLRHCDLGRS